MFGEIDDNKDISGKKGLQSVPQPARMSNGTPQSRNETSEAQPMEIELRPVLLVRERSRDKPTLFWPQFQQFFAPPKRVFNLTVSERCARFFPYQSGLCFAPLAEGTPPTMKYYWPNRVQPIMMYQTRQVVVNTYFAVFGPVSRQTPPFG
jgi:hypothetical protein